MIDGYPFTSIGNDISMLCEELEHFVAAERQEDSRQSAARLTNMSLWQRKIADSFDQVRNLIETDEGLPWGPILNAAMEFGQLTQSFGPESTDYPSLEDCSASLSVLRTFAHERFGSIMDQESAAAAAA